MMSSSDSVRKKSGMDVDRISKLPDSVLCNILAFLDTQMAVQTCVLSKRWKSVFTFVPRLTLDRISFSKKLDISVDEELGDFEKLVTMTLLKNRSDPLENFTLVYLQRAVKRSPFHGWIGTVISKNVGFLDLDVSSSHGMQGLTNLPHCIFSAKSLKTLKLKGDLLVDIPATCVVSLPRLESLSLSSVFYGCGDCFRKLVEGCTVLKSLFIRRLRYDNIAVFTVNSGTLEHLEILAWGFGSGQENVDMKLEIKTTFLKYLRLREYVSTDFSFGTLPILHELHLFDFDDEKDLMDIGYSSVYFGCKFALDLVNAIPLDKLKILLIGTEEILKVVAESRKLFPTITALTITSCWRWRTMMQLLRKTENLKFLKLKNKCRVFDEAEEEEDPPPCFSISLERISLISWIFSPYVMEWDQANSLVGMIKYFLKHGEILRRFELSCSYLDLFDMFLKKYGCRKQLINSRDAYFGKCLNLSPNEEGNIQRRNSRDILLGFHRKSSACEIHVLYSSSYFPPTEHMEYGVSQNQ